MKLLRNLILLLIYMVLMNSLFSQQKSYSVTDDKGRDVEFHQIPERVITLAPSITEFVYSLGCEDKLVGNTLYCNYPPAANEITKVGDIITFDYEKILSLFPDLVMLTVEGNTKETFNKLNGLGLKLFIVNPRNYEDIKDDFRKVAAIFRKDSHAEAITHSWDESINSIISKRKNNTNESVMIIVEISPLMLAGKNTFLNEYLEMLNLKNIAADSRLNYPVFNREQILARDPDLIIYPSSGTETIDFLLEYYPEWNGLRAVKNNRVIFVNRDMYFRPGPRFIDSIQDLDSKIN